MYESIYCRIVLYSFSPHHLGCGIAIESWVHAYRDYLGVQSLLYLLAVGSSAMHEVSHDPLFSAKLIRLAGEVMQVFSSDVGDGGSDPPCEVCGGGL